MNLKYDHLEGLPFNIEDRNCYTLLRDFYRDNFEIELTDYPCPTDWWEHDLNLYWRLAPEEGFYPVHEPHREWRGGDVVLMAINSSSGNHVAIVLDNGDIFHHLVGQRSLVTSYGGLFRNTTVGVYRHKDVASRKPPELLVDVRSVLPPHVLRRLEELERARGAAAPEVPAGG
jgi:hypothetical protein